MRLAFCGLAMVFVVAGCEPDLGACDMTAATTTVYNASGTPYYAGQAIVQEACTRCHGSASTGASRVGAPHGLNFNVGGLNPMSTEADVATARTTLAKIQDEAGDMYDQIESGTMPPASPAGNTAPLTWTFADGSAASLPDVRTDQGKSTVRNWLACKAPVIAGITGAPADAVAIGAIVPAVISTAEIPPTFTGVYTGVLMPSGCPGCHVPGGPGGFLDLSTPSIAYTSLVGKDAATSGTGIMCAGKGKRVVANDCTNSILYSKISMATPICGTSMPPGAGPLPQTQLDAVCNWIKAGATND
jgi:hypothetical protein